MSNQSAASRPAGQSGSSGKFQRGGCNRRAFPASVAEVERLGVIRFLRFVSFVLLLGSVASASAQTVRARLKKDPDFRIYSVIFGVTATTNSPLPAVRLAKVTDPKTGTTDV